MGTRNLTMVISGGKTRVAQYGQWDGYPEGQGKTILKFLHGAVLDKFREQLKKVRFTTKRDEATEQKFLESMGCKDGWMNSDQSDKWMARFPFRSRNHGAGILQLIADYKGKNKIVLSDATSFAGDSLMCEWAYVVDLDKNTFEIYQGFNKSGENSGRFADTKDLEKSNNDEYGAVTPYFQYDLNELPNMLQYLGDMEAMQKKEEEEYNAEN